jgi:hypothetical protein
MVCLLCCGVSADPHLVTTCFLPVRFAVLQEPRLQGAGEASWQHWIVTCGGEHEQHGASAQDAV